MKCSPSTVVLSGFSNQPAGTVSYQWFAWPGGNIVSGADMATAVVDQPGTYQLLLSNTISGCTATDLAIVVQNIAPPVVNIQAAAPLTCLLTQQNLQGQNPDPTGNYSYQWTASNGGNIVSGEMTLTPTVNAAGTYNLLTTNQNTGCTSSTSVQVDTDLESPNAALGVSGNLNCNTTEVNIENTSSTDPSLLNHAWANPDGTTGNTGTDPNWTATEVGTYVLLLTNTQNGCTSTSSATVTQSTSVTAEAASQTNATCFGGTDGTLSVTAGGGNGIYTYLWNTGETTPGIQNLASGTYTVVISDGENCTASLSLTIEQPDELLPNAVATGLTTQGSSDGTATAAPTGGAGPYTYTWSSGQTQQSINGLTAGFYTVTVTDTHGCTAEQTVEVWDGNCNLTAGATAVDPSCHGDSNGRATATPTGGAAPLTYAWSSGATTQTAENLLAGTYEVIVTDANDCAFTATATDENGYTSTVEVTIKADDQEAPVIQAAPTLLAVGPAGSVTLTLQNLGVTVSDNCDVDEVVFSPESFNCLQLGVQQVTVTATDASGNSSSLSFSVTVIDQEAPVVVCPANIRRCTGDDIVEYVAPVATDNCLMLGGYFDLIEGLASGEQFPEGTTPITYTFTDASGNVGACSFSVTILSPIEVMKDTIIHDVGGQHTSSVQVTVSGSQPGYTYAWQENGQTIATTEDLAGVGAGTYTLIVTDANGCTRLAGPYVVDDLVSTGGADWSRLIALYPNPTSGKVFAVFPDALTQTEIYISVFDAMGRKVQEQHSSGQKQVVLDWTAFADGMYTVLIRMEQGQAVYRVVLDR